MSLAFKEMEIQTTMRPHYTCTRIAKIIETNKLRIGKKCGKTGIFIH